MICAHVSSSGSASLGPPSNQRQLVFAVPEPRLGGSATGRPAAGSSQSGGATQPPPGGSLLQGAGGGSPIPTENKG